MSDPTAYYNDVMQPNLAFWIIVWYAVAFFKSDAWKWISIDVVGYWIHTDYLFKSRCLYTIQYFLFFSSAYPLCLAEIMKVLNLSDNNSICRHQSLLSVFDASVCINKGFSQQIKCSCDARNSFIDNLMIPGNSSEFVDTISKPNLEAITRVQHFWGVFDKNHSIAYQIWLELTQLTTNDYASLLTKGVKNWCFFTRLRLNNLYASNYQFRLVCDTSLRWSTYMMSPT